MLSPTPHIVSSPVDIDRHIEEMKVILSGVSWIDRAYGLAVRETKQNDAFTNVTYPRVYQGGKEHNPISVDDTIAATSFFYIQDSISYDDLTKRMTCDINLIVTCNVNRIYPPNTEYSIHPLIKELRQLNLGGGGLKNPSGYRDIKFNQYFFNRLSDVFPDFNFWEQDTKYRMQPINCFRILYSMIFSPDCL